MNQSLKKFFSFVVGTNDLKTNKELSKSLFNKGSMTEEEYVYILSVLSSYSQILKLPPVISLVGPSFGNYISSEVTKVCRDHITSKEILEKLNSLEPNSPDLVLFFVSKIETKQVDSEIFSVILDAFHNLTYNKFSKKLQDIPTSRKSLGMIERKHFIRYEVGLKVPKNKLPKYTRKFFVLREDLFEKGSVDHDIILFLRERRSLEEVFTRMRKEKKNQKRFSSLFYRFLKGLYERIGWKASIDIKNHIDPKKIFLIIEPIEIWDGMTPPEGIKLKESHNEEMDEETEEDHIGSKTESSSSLHT